MTVCRTEAFHFTGDGVVPNNPVLPLVVYRGVLPEAADPAAAFEALFAANGWPGAWRNGIYGHHHYHSTAHEVLGIATGSARVRFGGEGGKTVEVEAGDVVVIPAGVAHKREAASVDLLVVGAYPLGQRPDMCRVGAAERERALPAIAAVPLPASDPVAGAGGPLLEFWHSGLAG